MSWSADPALQPPSSWPAGRLARTAACGRPHRRSFLRPGRPPMPLEQFRGFPRDMVVLTRPSTLAPVAGATACLDRPSGYQHMDLDVRQSPPDAGERSWTSACPDRHMDLALAARGPGCVGSGAARGGGSSCSSANWSRSVPDRAGRPLPRGGGASSLKVSSQAARRSARGTPPTSRRWRGGTAGAGACRGASRFAGKCALDLPAVQRQGPLHVGQAGERQRAWLPLGSGRRAEVALDLGVRSKVYGRRHDSGYRFAFSRASGL